MATYYVSTQRGSDANNGTSPSTPWLTVTKAVQTLVAGDTCYIGSGTYREKPTNSNAGTIGNPIQFIGDPDSQYVIGDKKGIIRVTGCDVNDMPTTGRVWNSQKDYVTLKNMIIDGSSNEYSLYCTGTERKSENIVSIGCYGFGGGINTNCLAISSYYGFAGSGVNTNCLAIGGSYGYDGAGTNTNCVAIGGNYGFDLGTNINCLSIGAFYGFGSGTTNTNCLAISSYYGYQGATNTNCVAMSCYYGFGSSGKVYNCKASMCTNKINGTLYGDGTVSDAPIMLWTLANMQKIIEGFDPWMFEGAKQCGDNTVSLGALDILGRDRRMLSGVIDVGPYSFSNVQPNFDIYQNNSPSISIVQKGIKLFEIPAKANTPITVNVQTKHVDTIGNKPQILLRGKTISEQSATNTANDNVWQQLSVNATPTKDELLTLVLSARDHLGVNNFIKLFNNFGTYTLTNTMSSNKNLCLSTTASSTSNITEDFEDGTYSLVFSGDWESSTNLPYAGTSSFKSKTGLTQGQTSTMELNFELAAGTSITFYKKVSCNSSDGFKVYVDGVLSHSYLGSTSWVQLSPSYLNAGIHNIKCIFEKNVSTSTGDNAAYIDNVVINNYKTNTYNTSGTCMFEDVDVTGYTSIDELKLSWKDSVPTNTALTISYSTDGGSTWITATNGVLATNIPKSSNYIKIKATLTTSNTSYTPMLIGGLNMYYKVSAPTAKSYFSDITVV